MDNKRNLINFTKADIDSLPLPDKGKRETWHDKKTAGLQLRVSSSGAKTFSFLKRVKAGGLERVTLGRYPAMTIENARKEAARLNSLVVQGINPNSDARALKTETTLQELFEDFIKHRRNKRRAYLSDKTKRSYRYDFNKYFSKWGNKPLSKFRETDFGRLHTEVGKAHPVTANRLVAMASSLFAHAKDRKLFSGNNPAVGIKKFPEDARERFIQSDELPSFFAALAELPNETMRDYFLISLLTGARRSNVLSMRWKDVNFSRCEWFLETTKNGTPQTVTLSPEAISVLENRQNNGSQWVFESATSKSGHIEEPKKAWKALLAAAGLENLRIHDLRRTLGSWQTKAGASLSIIGKSLNHKSPATTAIYARLDLDPVRESVNTATTNMLVAAGLKQGGEVVPMKKTNSKPK